MPGVRNGIFRDPKWMQDCLAWMEAHPIKYTWYLIVLFTIPLLSLQVIGLLVQSFVGRHLGTVGLAAFEAIRAGAGWLESLQTSLWYVQTSRISYLEGANRLSEAGGMILLGSAWTVVVGTLLMVLCLIIVSPLMDILSPVEVMVAGSSQLNVIKSIGIDAFYLYSIHIPAAVGVSNFLGIAQGMRVVLSTLGPWIGFSALGQLLLLHRASGVSCGEQEAAARSHAEAANTTYQPFSQPCEEAKAFLIEASAITVVAVWVGVGCAASACYVVANQRGFFANHGFSIHKYWGHVKASGLFGRDFLERLGSVTLRSVINNSRPLLGLGAAIRMGTVDAAVFILADTIGEITYILPNGVASGAMMVATRCYGKGNVKSALRIIYMFITLTLLWAPVATTTTALFETAAPAVWVSELERAEFEEKVRTPFYLVIAQQPLRALLGVYGPLLMTVQCQRAWGPIVLAIFLLVWMPTYLAAVAHDQIVLLVAANCAYDLVHLVTLVFFVHCRGIPALKRGELKVDDTEAEGQAAGCDCPTQAPHQVIGSTDEQMPEAPPTDRTHAVADDAGGPHAVKPEALPDSAE